MANTKHSTHIFTTSGTTGHPKKIEHTQDFLDEVSQASIDRFGHTKKSKFLNLLAPMSIGNAVMMDNVQRIIGCEVLRHSFNPFTFIDCIHEVRPTFMVIPPNIWKIMRRHKEWHKLDLSSLDVLVVGGDFTPEGMLDELRSHGPSSVVNVYGSTEVPPPVLVGNQENTYSQNNLPNGVSIKFSNRSTLMCKWDQQEDWWDSEDVVEGSLDRFVIKGRERNMFKQGNQRIYPEFLEKVATDCGAELALCREDGRYAHIYFTGDLNEHSVRKKLLFVPKLKISKVRDIQIDGNLRKVLRNQKLEAPNEH